MGGVGVRWRRRWWVLVGRHGGPVCKAGGISAMVMGMMVVVKMIVAQRGGETAPNCGLTDQLTDTFCQIDLRELRECLCV